jgi:hypothetical protein
MYKDQDYTHVIKFGHTLNLKRYIQQLPVTDPCFELLYANSFHSILTSTATSPSAITEVNIVEKILHHVCRRQMKLAPHHREKHADSKPIVGEYRHMFSNPSLLPGWVRYVYDELSKLLDATPAVIKNYRTSRKHCKH